ncbi:N-acetylmuramoyl-L-alanine amidase [Bacillus salacetis]|uniref:N-acetylmuramoyl-L-alanine amidase n=2 Tax=Bacillus salacetis TaxID=2315464 RepID=A0A3A1R4H4_9BACI|nr:N-acetylmuramoyl-L-alanine amidase [Bacillus salacetis]
MIKKAFYSIICLLLLLGSSPIWWPDKAAAEGSTVTIGTDTVNVRNGPGLSFPVSKQVHKGDEFKIVSQENEWYEVQLSPSKTGWVAEWLVKSKAGQTALSGSVTENGLRVRDGAGTDYPVIDTLSKGQEVEIVETSGSWYKISAGGQSGWVHRDYIASGSSTGTDSEPDQVSTEEWTGVSTVDSLNIRSSAGLNTSILGKLSKGSTVSVTGSMSGWYRIQYQGSEGWVSSQYIEKSMPAPASSENSSHPGYGKVSIYSLNVRDKASLDGKVVGSVEQGESYEILEEKNNWYKLSLKGGKTGWAAGWYIEKTAGQQAEKKAGNDTSGQVQILYNGTNLRSEASTGAPVVARASSGESFAIQEKQGDWYKVAMNDGQSAYLAGWIVSVSDTSGNPEPVNKPKTGGLKGKTIVIDPGHGGHDSGTIGYRGTLEKELTLSTSQLLFDLLRNAGADVKLTRSDDTYYSLNTRVALAHYHDSDAFISIHYDSINDSSIKGYTSYYYHQYQKELSQTILDSLSEQLSSKNRGVKKGDYYVIRENKQPAVLLELGYLSNPSEEASVTTHSFQDMAARSIYNGLTDYFAD